MKNKASAATKAEKDRIKRLFLEVGCICCLLRFGLKNSHVEIHHIVSIANGRKAFNAIHGTELNLWLKCQHMLGLDDELPTTKLVPRRLEAVSRSLPAEPVLPGGAEGDLGLGGSRS